MRQTTAAKDFFRTFCEQKERDKGILCLVSFLAFTYSSKRENTRGFLQFIRQWCGMSMVKKYAFEYNFQANVRCELKKVYDINV
jgi:hypothetical protein